MDLSLYDVEDDTDGAVLRRQILYVLGQLKEMYKSDVHLVNEFRELSKMYPDAGTQVMCKILASSTTMCECRLPSALLGLETGQVMYLCSQKVAA